MSDPRLGPALAGAVDLSGLVKKNQAPPPAAAPSSGLVRDVDDRSVAALVELSKTVPVILEVYGGEVAPVLGPIIESYQGRFVLGTVRGESAPELVKALQVEGIPTVLALIAGQPVPLFKGIPAEQEVRAILDQVLGFAQENGVTGQVDPGPAPEAEGDQNEPALPPLHQEAFDALSRNDLPGAKAAYQKALAEAPADADAAAGLAQVELLERVYALDADQVRRAAAEQPESVDRALEVADLDISGGHVEDAFVRVLGLYSAASDEDKERLRERLLTYFTIVGQAAPEVKKARAHLTSLMF
ncbi:MAG: tetratricopeptide repeat protein [Actinomycetota bacterium]|nr:tetratricopeptide repeat protein [Actinomycetota bacterium]